MKSQTVVHSRPSHDLILDVLRGLAALAVFFSHSDHAHLFYYPLLVESKEWLGQFGVDLFFILSGFLIWTSAKTGLPSPEGLLRYCLNRATRLVPLYWLSLAAAIYYIPVLGSDFKPQLSVETIVRHLTFTQSFEPPVARAINPVLWTISHEVLFYALVPVLLWSKRVLRIEWVLAASALLASSGVSEWLGPFGPFAKVFYLFAFGIACGEFRDRFGGAASLFLAALAFGAPRIGLEAGFGSALAAMAVFVAGNTWRGELQKSLWMVPVLDPLRRLGIVSYSLYIWHYLLLNVISNHVPDVRLMLAGVGLPELWTDLNFRAAFTGVTMVVVSSLSYGVIERPAMTWVRNGLMALAVEVRRGARG